MVKFMNWFSFEYSFWICQRWTEHVFGCSNCEPRSDIAFALSKSSNRLPHDLQHKLMRFFEQDLSFIRSRRSCSSSLCCSGMCDLGFLLLLPARKSPLFVLKVQVLHVTIIIQYTELVCKFVEMMHSTTIIALVLGPVHFNSVSDRWCATVFPLRHCTNFT